MQKQIWLGFGVYCLLAGSTWLAVAYLAPTWPELLRLFVHDGLLCVVFVLAALSRQPRFPWRSVVEPGLWCGLLFAGAPVLAAGAGGSVSSLTEVLSFTMVPVLTVFLVAQRDANGEGMRMLGPVLAGIGGLALLLPFEWPATSAGWGWFGALVGCGVLMAVAGIRLHDLLGARPVLPVAAAGCGVAAVLAGLGWRWFQTGPVEVGVRQVVAEGIWAMVVDGTLALLMLWLAKRLKPVSLSARFLLVPWVTIAGGLVVLRQNVGWTSVLGLALSLGAGGYVLVASGDA